MLELPLLKLPEDNCYLMAIGCGQREDAYNQSQHCLGVVVEWSADGRCQRVADMHYFDAGQLGRLGRCEFKVSRIETREESLQSVQDVVGAEGKGCQIRIAASMLDELRDRHQLEFLRDGFGMRYDNDRQEEDSVTNEKTCRPSCAIQSGGQIILVLPELELAWREA